MSAKSYPNTWAGVKAAATDAGARYPELVAAQWALESGRGESAPGHNYFGLKGSGQQFTTQEELSDGTRITIKDDFLVFENLYASIEYLVKLWYKDYKSYKGVNNAPNRNAAARQLRQEGYATDSRYADKLIELMDENEPVAVKPASGGKPVASRKPRPAAPAEKPLFWIEALQATWLKKGPGQADDLPEDEKVAVPAGRRYGVLKVEEQAGDAHARVTLAAGGGTWLIWEPHFRSEQQAASGGAAAGPQGIDWSDFDALVTPHLTVGEVLQWDRRRRPAANSADIRRIWETAQQFEAIRAAWGKPLGVTSFYRPEPINTEVGGVHSSRHISGRAMDIYPVGASLESFYQWIRVRWRGGLGDGRRRGFIHLDTDGGSFVPGAGARPSAEWNY